METSEIKRAVGATTALASKLNLAVSDARVVCNSNKLALRLLPCNVFARVAFAGHEAFASEIDIARLLAETGSPVASLAPEVPPCVHEQDEFAVTLWRHYEHSGEEVPAHSYARALERLHLGMAQIDVSAPHFTERVAEAQELVAAKGRTPARGDSDRELLRTTLQDSSQRIRERSSREQLLHGEPHRGNLLNTSCGVLFIDLETCCRGPVEFDLAHAPAEVSESYRKADQELIHECRHLVLAMVAAWRCDPEDEFPNGRRARRRLIAALRAGPPWLTLDAVMNRAHLP